MRWPLNRDSIAPTEGPGAQHLQALPVMHVSAGRRGLEVALAPADLVALTEAEMAGIGRP